MVKCTQILLPFDYSKLIYFILKGSEINIRGGVIKGIKCNTGFWEKKVRSARVRSLILWFKLNIIRGGGHKRDNCQKFNSDFCE